MNCNLFSEHVTDLVRGKLDDRTRQEALAHALACANCAALLAEERRLSEKLHTLAMSQRNEQAPAEMETRLLGKFRNVPPASGRPRSAGWYWVAAAIAAALLLAVLLIPRKQPPSAQPPRAQQPPKIEKPVPVVAEIPKPPRKHKRKPPAAVTPLESEIATDFMPVPYASPLRAGEPAEVVRVQVPRTTLLSFGLPMNEERAAEPIKADLVVGTDGMARAIRFVNDAPVLPRPILRRLR